MIGDGDKRGSGQRGWKRFFRPGFENPLLRYGAWVLFTMLVIRLSFVEPGGRVPEAGSKAATYYMAPRNVVCEKPNPSYQSQVEKVRAEVSPVYSADDSFLDARADQLRGVEEKLGQDLAALAELERQAREIEGQVKGTERRIKESPFFKGEPGAAQDAAADQSAQQAKALEGRRREVLAHATALLTSVAPGLSVQDAEAVIEALRRDPVLLRDTFRAAAMCLDEVRRWLVIETSDLAFQKDRGHGIVVARTGKKLAPEDHVMSYVEALDLVRGKVVDRLIGENFPRLKGNRQLVPFVMHVAVTFIRVNFRRDEKATQTAMDTAAKAVAKVKTVEFTQGQTIVAMNEEVAEWQRDCLARLSARSFARAGAGEVLGVPVPTLLLLLGITLMSVAASGALVGFARRVLRERPLSGGDYIALGVLLIFHVALVRLFMLLGEVLSVPYPELSRGVLLAAAPVALSVMMVNTLMGAGVALLSLLFLLMITATIAVLSGTEVLSGNFPSYYALYMLTVCAVGIWLTRRVTRRGGYFLAGILSGGAGLLFWVAVYLLERGQVPLNHAAELGLASLASGGISYVLLVSLTPLFEYLWDYTTDSRLIELASTDHPALKELSRRAPGTYQHSLWLATLVEEAAERIGANPLLAKVGAYYHDLGKLMATSETGLAGGAVDSPLYFAENQLMGANPHDHLTPETSARVLRKHVEQSIRMIRKYRLGAQIMDIAAQHHGTTIMEHFYNRARAAAEERGETVREEDFRYPGPKPQTKEAALVMLADAVEAYVRALPQHTEEKITERVHGMLQKRCGDAQLDESTLTFLELKTVEDSFVKSLLTMYHARPEYQKLRPEEKTVRVRKEDVPDDPDEQKTVQIVRKAVVPAPDASGPSSAPAAASASAEKKSEHEKSPQE